MIDITMLQSHNQLLKMQRCCFHCSSYDFISIPISHPRYRREFVKGLAKERSEPFARIDLALSSEGNYSTLIPYTWYIIYLLICFLINVTDSWKRWYVSPCWPLHTVCFVFGSLKPFLWCNFAVLLFSQQKNNTWECCYK